MNNYVIHPIGVIRTPYAQKFGIARQSRLVPSSRAVIELNAEFSADCVRGLDEFDYIWLQFLFHQTIHEGWSPLVRPPRLGGKIKKGVFATRSPHRPNGIGLSLVKLEKIEEVSNRIHIAVSGVDLLDNTPVIDIKPYLPHIEAVNNASGGFTTQNLHVLSVCWSENIKQNLPHSFCQLLEETLAQDPRPAHQHELHKKFVMLLDDYEVQFSVLDNQATILSVQACQNRKT